MSSFPAPTRFVQVSSAGVYHPRRPTVRATEGLAPVERYLNAYAASNAAAERLVLAERPDAVVLRPHAVYGAGDTTLLPRLLSAIRHGRVYAGGLPAAPGRLAGGQSCGVRLSGHAPAPAPRLTRYVVSHLAYERALDLTAARTRLGYRPSATSFVGAFDW